MGAYLMPEGRAPLARPFCFLKRPLVVALTITTAPPQVLPLEGIVAQVCDQGD